MPPATRTRRLRWRAPACPRVLAAVVLSVLLPASGGAFAGRHAAGRAAKAKVLQPKHAHSGGRGAFGPPEGSPRGAPPPAGQRWSDAQRVAYREEAREMFYHAYDSYLRHALPADDLAPISCKGRHAWGRARARGSARGGRGGTLHLRGVREAPRAPRVVGE